MELYNNLVKHVENQAETFGMMTEGKQIETVAKVAGAAVAAGIVAGVCAPVLIPVAIAGGAYAAFSYCVHNYQPVNFVADHGKNIVAQIKGWF